MVKDVSLGQRKFDNSKRYFYALVVALSLFFFGFFISYGIHAFEFQKTSVLQDSVFYNFYKTQLSYELFNNSNCSSDYLDQIGKSLDFQGSMLANLENKFGKDNKYVKERKAYYSLLELSHYEEMKKLNNKCDLNKSFILFFYSNDKDYLDYSVKVGNILSYLKKANPNVLIYSFDVDSVDPLVHKLVLKYEIEDPVLVIIDGKYRLTSIHNIDEINEYL